MAVLFHFGYLLVLPGIVGLLGLTRIRAMKLAKTGATLASLGFACLAGAMLVDLSTLGAGQQLGTNEAVSYLDETGGLVGAAQFFIPAFLSDPRLLGAGLDGREVGGRGTSAPDPIGFKQIVVHGLHRFDRVRR